MKKIVAMISVALVSVSGFSAGVQSSAADTLGLDKASAVSPVDLLKGRFSGVRISDTDGNPSGLKNVNIRGINSLRGDSQPLYIVDGVQMNRGINDNRDPFSLYGEASYVSGIGEMLGISAYDIESIEVLKDLSATAIYGSRGANGVVIIRTRLPKAADRVISWNSNVMVHQGDLGGSLRGFSHNHNFSLGGSVNQSSYNISANYRRTEGVTARTSDEHFGMKMNFDTKANKVVWFGVNALVSMGKMSGTLGTNWYGLPSYTLAKRDAGFSPLTSADNWAKGYDDNPEDYSMTSSAYLTLNLTPHFTWKTEGGVDFRSVKRFFWYDPVTEFGASRSGVAAILSNTLLGYNVKTTFKYDRYVAENHHLTAALGAQTYGNLNKYNTMSGDDFFTSALRAKGLSLMNSEAVLRKYAYDYNTLSAFVSLGYDFKQIAGVNLLVNAGRTSRFDEELSIYSSVSGYFDLKKAFLAGCAAVSTLRLTGGFGEAGFEQAMPYQFISLYQNVFPDVEKDGQAYYEGVSKVFSREFNAGLETGFLGDRILFSAKYYAKHSDDDFTIWSFGTKGSNYWYSAPKSVSFNGSTAKVFNTGLEFDLGAKICSRKDFSWDVNANFTYNINQLENSVPDMFDGCYAGNGIFATANVLGRSISSICGYKTGSDGNPIDYNRDGVISSADRQILAETMPKFFGAFGTTVRIKDWTFDALVDGAAGFSILNMNSMLKDGAIYVTDKYVEKGDFLRLSRLSVSYSIPENLRWLRGIEVNLSALNLLTLTSYSGLNPDVNCFGLNSRSAGIDYGSYPNLKTILLGVNLKF